MKNSIFSIRKRIIPLACSLAMAMACSLAADQDKSKSAALSDEDVSRAIDREFKANPLIPEQKIQIRTEDGRAILSGQAPSLQVRQQAEIIASMVRGVKTVDNQIQVRPNAKRTDQQLEQDIENAWLLNTATESFELSADVKQGKATIQGTVQSPTERRLAQAVVSRVPGITAIQNEIKVKQKYHRSPSELKAEIEQMMHWDAHLDDAQIQVDVSGSRVRLSGQVPSAAEKSRAISTAWVAGVSQVDASGLQVADWTRKAKYRLGKFAPRNDMEIARAVDRALLYNPYVYSFQVDPYVKDGVVTLQGTVNNQKAKRVAGSVAQGIVGVKRVNNQIQVVSQELSDSQIARRVRDALALDSLVDGYEINVQVQDGKVLLKGTVDTYLEKAQADDVAAQVRGAKSVDNQLNVYSTYLPLTYSPYLWDYDYRVYPWYEYHSAAVSKSDAEIKDDIEAQLFWSPYVDENQVQVSVTNGVATLTGTVESFDEKIAAGKNAIDGGAVNVHNQLATTGEYDWPF